MAVTEISTVSPLSKYWTYRQVYSEAAVLTNTIDNENVQLSNVRNHINMSISYLANLLSLANKNYGIWLKASLEPSLHPSGLEWIDLREPLNNIVPYQLAEEIKTVSFVNNNVSKDWVGNARIQDISELVQLKSNQNNQWSQSIAWRHYGAEVLLFIGSDIQTLNQGSANSSYDIQNQEIMLWSNRTPYLDNMKALTDNENNFDDFVDLPDKYIELLVKMVMQKILMQIREQVPEKLENEINQGIANINQLLELELRQEAAFREKKQLGNQQKATMGG